jgi:putative membrane protein
MKKKIFLPFATGVLLTVISVSCNNSSENAKDTTTDSSVNTTSATTSTAPVSAPTDSMSQNPDAKLVYELTESMYAGIALMKDGEQKATNPAVKALAAKLVTEHSKLTKDLEALSAKKGWPLPSGEPSADMQKREAMNKEEVAQFQKDWLTSLRDRHETNIGKLENAKPSDPDVKAAGEKGLPKIKELLGDIKTVQANLK